MGNVLSDSHSSPKQVPQTATLPPQLELRDHDGPSTIMIAVIGSSSVDATRKNNNMLDLLADTDYSHTIIEGDTISDTTAPPGFPINSYIFHKCQCSTICRFHYCCTTSQGK